MTIQPRATKTGQTTVVASTKIKLPYQLPETYFEEILVNPAKKAIEFQIRKISINFQSCVQDIISHFGFPTLVFYKAEDKLRIYNSQHNASNTSSIFTNASPNSNSSLTGTSSNSGGYLRNSSQPITKNKSSCQSDYFYNYFLEGIDFLFDWRTHKVKKIILHSNYPLDVHFNKYRKCNFSILTDTERVVLTDKWEQVLKKLGKYEDRGVPISHEKSYLPKTLAYGFPSNSLIISVTQCYISSLCMYNSGPC